MVEGWQFSELNIQIVTRPAPCYRRVQICRPTAT